MLDGTGPLCLPDGWHTGYWMGQPYQARTRTRKIGRVTDIVCEAGPPYPIQKFGWLQRETRLVRSVGWGGCCTGNRQGLTTALDDGPGLVLGPGLIIGASIVDAGPSRGKGMKSELKQ